MKKLNTMKFKVGDILENESGNLVKIVGITNDDKWKYITMRLSNGFIDCKKEKHLNRVNED